MNLLSEMFLLAPHQNTLAHLIHVGARQHSRALWHKRIFGTVSYARADACSNDVAAFLIAMGCRPGYHFYMPPPQTYEDSMSLFGAIKAGLVLIEPGVAGFEINQDQLLNTGKAALVTFLHHQFCIGNKVISFKKAIKIGAGTLFFIPHLYQDTCAIHLLSAIGGHGEINRQVLLNQEVVDLVQCPENRSRLTPAMRLIERWCAGEERFG